MTIEIGIQNAVGVPKFNLKFVGGLRNLKLRKLRFKDERLFLPNYQLEVVTDRAHFKISNFHNIDKYLYLDIESISDTIENWYIM